jgi:cold shock CspA family protein
VRADERREFALQGTLIWFNPEKRHGFIRTEEGERLLVEESGFEPGHLLGDRCAGTPLTFVREDATAGGDARAVRVSVVPEVVQRRARSRSRARL